MMTTLASTGAHAGAKKRRRALQERGAEGHQPVEEDLEQEDPGQGGAHPPVLLGVDRGRRRQREEAEDERRGDDGGRGERGHRDHRRR